MKKIILTAIVLVSSITFFGQDKLHIDVANPNAEILRLDNNGLRSTSFNNYSYGSYDNAGLQFKKNSSVGQFKFSNNNGDLMTILSSGNIGVGTSTPQSSLHLNNTAKNIDNFIITTSPTGEVPDNIFVVSNQNGSGVVKMKNRFGIDQITFNTEGDSYINGGNVGIGTTNPDSELTVDGTVHCEEVLVDLNVDAPDYVFEKYYTGVSELKEDYTMPTLEEVEAYTKENHHLPNVPSAKEIKEEGLHLKEMTNLLLQKIEELTLYTIEQEKRIKTLEGKLATKE